MMVKVQEQSLAMLSMNENSQLSLEREVHSDIAFKNNNTYRTRQYKS